jgi:ribonuclease T1
MIPRGLVAIALALAFAGAAPVAAQKAEPATIQQVDLRDLPHEAAETIALIHKKGPYLHAKDGAVFGNREGHLPKREKGYYREYTVRTPGERTRGARRIVAGKKGEFYYSGDHYKTFRLIRE